MKVSAIAASAMLMPPDAEPVMPASALTRDRFVHQRIRNRLQRVGDDQEARQRGDHAAEAVFRRRVHRREQRAGDRGLAAVGETLASPASKASTITVTMPRSSAPSTAQIAATLTRLCVAGAAWPAPGSDGVGRAVLARDQRREHLVRDADDARAARSRATDWAASRLRTAPARSTSFVP